MHFEPTAHYGFSAGDDGDRVDRAVAGTPVGAVGPCKYDGRYPQAYTIQNGEIAPLFSILSASPATTGLLGPERLDLATEYNRCSRVAESAVSYDRTGVTGRGG